MRPRGIGLAAFIVALAACGGPEREVPPSEFRNAHGALCTAIDQARRGRTFEARTTFFNRSHGTLHVLAARLDDTDRRAAARVLTAKQEVESGRWDDADPSLVPRLSRLAESTRDGIAAAGETAPEACANQQ